MNPDKNNDASFFRLRGEIRKVIEREYAIFGKFLELSASLEAVVPDENLRYEAALQALAATIAMSRQEIIEAVGRQRTELAGLEASVGELFREIGTQMDCIRMRAGGAPGAESAAPARTGGEQICRMCGARMNFDRREDKWKCHSCSYEDEPGEKADARNDWSPGAPAQQYQDTAWRKKCPACGGQINFHAAEHRWLCYTCAYEEHGSEEATSGREKEQEEKSAPGPAGTPDFAVPLSAMVGDETRQIGRGTPWSSKQRAPRTKSCPVCRKKMDWHEIEKIWKCFFCNHKTRY